MKKLGWVVLMIGLLAVLAWIFLSYIAWRIPSPAGTRGMALADLDGDGDLDAFLANGRNEGTVPNAVLFNDGNGRFRDSGQQLGDSGSVAVTLQDFDADGDVDALVSNDWGSFFEYFWNDGQGQFPRSQTAPIPTQNEGYFAGIWRFAAADLNGDALVDLFLVGCCGGAASEGSGNWTPLNAHNTVWFNNGSSLTAKDAQQFGPGSSEAVALADLDGDGDLDAFTANSFYMDEDAEPVAYDPNAVWLNDGAGFFTDSGQRLGQQRSTAVALGDLDGDCDQDAFVGNRGADEVWWNDGHANFSDSKQGLGNGYTRGVFLADLDGDGDLDAVAAGDERGQIWLNDGQGRFQMGSQFRYAFGDAVTLGDVDGDGTVDVVAGKLDDALVWFNDGTGKLQR